MCTSVCEVLFSWSATPAEGNRLFNEVSLCVCHEDEFMSGHTGRQRASGPRFDGGPRSLLQVCSGPLQPLKTQGGEVDTRIR